MVLWLAKHAPTASTTKAQVGAMSTMVTPQVNKLCSHVVLPQSTLHPPVPWLCWLWVPALQARAQYPEIGGLLYGEGHMLLCLLSKGN